MKQITIMFLILVSISLLLQACGTPTPDMTATIQAVRTQDALAAEQTALAETQTAMGAEKAALAMTQTAVSIPVAMAVPVTATKMLVPVSSGTLCPLYVYQDWGADANKFVAEGWMGDISDINLDDNFKLDTNRSNIIKITYTPQGGQGWAGAYWWVPGTNWGNGDDVGINVSCASKLTFWVRGEKGGEKAEFKVGGIKGTYSDSLQPAFSSGPITLTKEWIQYTINLTGKNLSHIMGGFVWVIKESSNKNGAVIYLDEIKFEQ
jgi:hypothetical protein